MSRSPERRAHRAHVQIPCSSSPQRLSRPQKQITPRHQQHRHRHRHPLSPLTTRHATPRDATSRHAHAHAHATPTLRPRSFSATVQRDSPSPRCPAGRRLRLRLTLTLTLTLRPEQLLGTHWEGASEMEPDGCLLSAREIDARSGVPALASLSHSLELRKKDSPSHSHLPSSPCL